jgi:hypothetical protein
MSESMIIGIDGIAVEATEEEAAKILKTQADLKKVETALQAEKAAKEAARESAIAKLGALGLTAEEIAALKG